MQLLDENLPRRLAKSLADVFPGLRHVAELNLLSATNVEVWNQAIERGLAIISKDDDFRQRSLLHGHPPKVIWLRIGNASVAEVEAWIRAAESNIKAFLMSDEESLLVID